jgi:hypothetical protein
MNNIIFCGVWLLIAMTRLSAQPITITNYFTERYRDIPMTRISLLLPDGFVWDTLDNEYRNEQQNITLRSEEVSNAFPQVRAEFLSRFTQASDAYLSDSLGFLLTSSERFRINGFDAMLCSLLVSDDWHSDIEHTWLFIGDSTRTYVIKMIGGRSDASRRDKQTTLLSVIYDPARVIIPRGGDPTVKSSSSCKCNDKK